jgi:hypothetical protein
MRTGKLTLTLYNPVLRTREDNGTYGRKVYRSNVTICSAVGCCQSAQTVTQFVDDLQPALRANRDRYIAGPHTPARQLAALTYFDAQWRWLHSSQACGSKMLGKAGKAGGSAASVAKPRLRFSAMRGVIDVAATIMRHPCTGSALTSSRRAGGSDHQEPRAAQFECRIGPLGRQEN